MCVAGGVVGGAINVVRQLSSESSGVPDGDPIQETPAPLVPEPQSVSVAADGTFHVTAGHVGFVMPVEPVFKKVATPVGTSASMWTATTADGKIMVVLASFSADLGENGGRDFEKGHIDAGLEQTGGQITVDEPRVVPVGQSRHVVMQFPTGTRHTYYIVVGSTAIAITGVTSTTAPPLALQSVVDSVTISGR